MHGIWYTTSFRLIHRQTKLQSYTSLLNTYYLLQRSSVQLPYNPISLTNYTMEEFGPKIYLKVVSRRNFSLSLP